MYLLIALTDLGWVIVAICVAFFLFAGWHGARDEAKQKRRKEEHEREVRNYFARQFQRRVDTIGKIQCPQCKWTGHWGDAMSYEEFFAYEIINDYGLTLKAKTYDANNLSNESQYKCPVCKSTNWQKL